MSVLSATGLEKSYRKRKVVSSLSLSFESGEVVGRFQSSQSDSALYGGKWDSAARSLSFEYDYPHGGRLPVTARLEGEKLSGKIGENAEFVAVREAAGR